MDYPQGGSPPIKRDDGRRETKDLHEKVWDLERRVEKQSVTLQALCALLEEKGISPAALLAAVRRVEQDRASAAVKPCARCGRAIGRRQSACVYCGEPRVVESAFEEL
jgi:hypothetical protein